MIAPEDRVVVAGWSGTTNLGDELLLRSLLGVLGEHGLGATVVSRDPGRTTAWHGVDAIGLADVPGLLRHVRDGRGMVLGPGGLLQDETSPFSLPWHLSRAAVAALARRPLVGVGLGAGPLARPGSRRLTGALLRRARAVTVRDQASARLLAACGVHAVPGCDLALGLPPVEVAPQDRIVVCLRPHRPGGHLVPLRGLPSSELDEARIAAVAAGLDELAGAVGLPLHLVAMEAGRDDRYHELVASRMRSPVSVSVPDLDGVLAEIGRSRLVVAMRFHAGVAALLAGRPSVLVGYAPKVGSLAREVGPGTALVTDDGDGYVSLARAAERVLARDADLGAARGRLAAGMAVHHGAVERLVGA